MMHACRRGHLAMCKWLAAHGAGEDVMTKDEDQCTPLSRAQQEGQAHDSGGIRSQQ